jgi:hypothetical protein
VQLSERLQLQRFGQMVLLGEEPNELTKRTQSSLFRRMSAQDAHI